MKAMILNIGDELLIGQIVNTNASYIARILNANNIEVKLIEVVSDDANEILEHLNRGLNYDLVIITGGLGPTNDDVTKYTLAQFTNDSLVMNEVVLKDIENLLNTRNRKINELNKQQALVLSKSDVIRNFLGTAPGMIIQKENTIFVSLPGVPYEMKPMLNEAIKRILTNRGISEKIIHKSVLVLGLAESDLAIKIKDWEKALYADEIKLAYLPNRNLIRLRLSAFNIENAKHKIQQHIEKLKFLLNKHFVGEEDWNETSEYPLAHLLIKKLKENNLTISFAESCTGGSISSALTKISGASDVLKGSIVSYSNEVKIKTLGVLETTIQNYGAVSEECVKEMVMGVQQIMKTDIAMSVSGIAGPTGGTKEKPVGTVWMALYYQGNIETKLFQFGENTREYIIDSAVFASLAWILKKILNI